MYPTPMNKGRDGVYRQAAARLLVAANDNEHDRQMRADDWYWNDAERRRLGLDSEKEVA